MDFIVLLIGWMESILKDGKLLWRRTDLEGGRAHLDVTPEREVSPSQRINAQVKEKKRWERSVSPSQRIDAQAKKKKRSLSPSRRVETRNGRKKEERRLVSPRKTWHETKNQENLSVSPRRERTRSIEVGGRSVSPKRRVREADVIKTSNSQKRKELSPIEEGRGRSRTPRGVDVGVNERSGTTMTTTVFERPITSQLERTRHSRSEYRKTSVSSRNGESDRKPPSPKLPTRSDSPVTMRGLSPQSESSDVRGSSPSPRRSRSRYVNERDESISSGIEGGGRGGKVVMVVVMVGGWR
ncbi:hypothetical protein BC829DRAFT_435963 [Chytridium lagenaria]|nr:hypothetical protein BC829DRAFT_435963 [Chytridium lagenaria]